MKKVLDNGFIIVGLLISIAAGVSCVTVPDELYDLIPTPTSTTTMTTVPPALPATMPPAVEDDNSSTPNAQELHGPIYGMDGATEIRRESSQVNNPANSRGKLKFIVSGKRAGTIVRVYCFKGDFRDTLKRATPNESGNRQRYYGSHAPADYPQDLSIRIDCNVDGAAKDVIYILKDPTKREG